VTEVDCIIVGQGLAGTSLAWQMLRRGRSVCLVDPDEPVTSSKIAAGLITPITGKRAVLSWKFFDFYPAAVSFYNDVERQTGSQFFRELPHYRLFATEAESSRFAERSYDLPGTPGIARMLEHSHELPFVSDWQGGFEMRPAAQLNTAAYLQVSREFFEASPLACRWSKRLTENDLQVTGQGVFLPERKLTGRNLVYCRGASEQNESAFPELPFLPAKGEILTLSVDSSWNQVIHRGIWVAPGPERSIRVGATYDSQQLDQTPTEAGREYLLERLRQFLHWEGDILAHQAAVRPALNNQCPVIARHPQFSQIYVMNGLGSKGALQSPLLAEQLANVLTGSEEGGCEFFEPNEG